VRTSRSLAAAFAVVVALTVAGGCGATSPSRSVRPVIAVSVDGLNPTALVQLGPGRLPTFFALIRGGASTLNARTEVERTETLPNHTGMLTGRPVEGPTGHGVDFNTDPGKVTVSSHADRPVASVFDVVHQAGRSTAMYASKTKFALYQRSWAGSIDRAVIDEDNERLVDRLVADLDSQPAAFTFVHLSAPDIAGHDRGFMSAAYLRAVEQVDGLLGRIRAAIATSPGLRAQATVIITADHGGRGTNGHAAADKLDDYRIPFIVAGPKIKAGTDLYDLNPDYRDPGASRPSYAGEQPVRNGNVADLSTQLLGLPTVPGSVFGVREQLDVR
jgi:predicted AlkP superfamily pyrophosphatase or phosphodiesterase